jgi:Polyketide cyclase / dehydrase and lipid transport
MRRATATVRIRRPRAAVNAVLVDLTRRSEFLDHFLTDWSVTSAEACGPGASARLRATGGGSGDELELQILDVSPQRIVEEARGGRRHWHLRYELDEVTDAVTQVRFTAELVACSPLDRMAWPLMRSHLERQYGQALLRLKGVLESETRAR